MFTLFQAALGMWKIDLFGYSLVSMDQSFRGQKKEFWEELGAIKGRWDEPWCVGRDFNSIRFPGERRYGHNLTAGMRRFSEVIEELNLNDLLFPSGQFTWFGSLNSQAASRLDRFLITNEWEDHFSGVFQSTLPKMPQIIVPFSWRARWIKKRQDSLPLREYVASVGWVQRVGSRVVDRLLGCRIY